MFVISVNIIPSRNHLHPIVSCDNAMCLNLGGASLIASSIVTVPQCQTYSIILSVKSWSVSASSSHRSSADVTSWNASTWSTSGTGERALLFWHWSCSKGTYHSAHHDASNLGFYLLPLYSSPAHTSRPETVGIPSRAVSGTREANQPCWTRLWTSFRSREKRTVPLDVQLRILCAHLYPKSFLSLDKHADRFEWECLLWGKICHIVRA